MIRFDDQPPMSSAADAWAESVLIKSDKYRNKKISNFFQYGTDKEQRIYTLPKQININNIFLFNIHGGAWEFGYPEWMFSRHGGDRWSIFNYWWIDPEKEKSLQVSQQNNTSLPILDIENKFWPNYKIK